VSVELMYLSFIAVLIGLLFLKSLMQLSKLFHTVEMVADFLEDNFHCKNNSQIMFEHHVSCCI